MIAWNNKRLIKGALKAAHVRPDYDRYDDLYQNAVIVYAQMLEEYSETERKKLDKLAFQKIIWTTLNSLHKVQVSCERCASEIEAEYLSEEFNYDELLILKDEFSEMRKIEQHILIDHLVFQKSLTQLANEHNIHRVSLQRIKRKLLIKLRNKYLEK